MATLSREYWLKIENEAFRRLAEAEDRLYKLITESGAFYGQEPVPQEVLMRAMEMDEPQFTALEQRAMAAAGGNRRKAARIMVDEISTLRAMRAQRGLMRILGGLDGQVR